MTPRPRPAIVRAFAELRRRRVFATVAGYVVLSALLIELSGAVFEALLFPDWTARLVTVLLILGLPVVVLLSWFFDISLEGIARTAEPDEGAGPVEGLEPALRRAGAAPVPEAPVRRRRRAAAEPPTEPVDADPERVRAAVLGHVRHELRTPINGIVGYSEMLLEDVSEPEIVADLERIREAGRQLLDRVDGALLRDAAPGNAPDDLAGFAEQVRVDLRTPVSAVVGYAEMLLESCEEAGRDELLPDLERIRASAHRLLERSEDIVRLATRSSDGAVDLGESSALTERVLSKIRPVGAGSEPEAEGRLLVVDDNEDNRDLISRQLARFGYTVATARDGKEALDRLAGEDFDLILLDVIMPRLDGVETLTRLRADERLVDVPVIMLSSLNELDSAVRCIEMGATDYISKPVQATLLEARIAAALEVRELRGRERAYRRRVEADAALIDRLLEGCFPAAIGERVRGGSLDIRERYSDVAAVRIVFPPDHRPSSGPDGLERVERVQASARVVEALAAEHAALMLLWRPEGALLVFGEGETDGARRAAGFALAARRRIDGLAAGAHYGSVVAGVVGESGPRFEIWGEGADAAEALAAHAGTGTILVTPAIRSALGESFGTEARGVKEVAGRGQMRVFALQASADDGKIAASG